MIVGIIHIKKTHALNTAYLETELVKQGHSVKVFDKQADIYELIALSDYVLTNTSCTCLDAIKLDVPIIQLDTFYGIRDVQSVPLNIYGAACHATSAVGVSSIVDHRLDRLLDTENIEAFYAMMGYPWETTNIDNVINDLESVIFERKYNC